MNYILKKRVLAIMLLTVTFASANVNFGNIRIFSESTKSLNIELKNNDGGLNVYIKDIYGVELYNEQFKGRRFLRTYDLSLLPDGDYFIEIVGQTKINMIPFIVSGINVEVLEMKKELIHKPIVRIQDDLVYISKFSQSKGVLKIVFYDEDNNILVEEKLRDEVINGKIFSLAKLPKGKYKLTATYSNNRVYTQEIVK